MSCPCPSGYTPTIDSDDCIYTITAATSGGTFFYTAATGSSNIAYCSKGVIMYEDITNLSFPISNSGVTGSTSAYTQNGQVLYDTEFLIDNSGRVLNIQAGGQGTPYGPPTLLNSLWGDGNPIYNGRLNDAGIWTTISPNPTNEWIGFSYCLDIPIKGTYLIAFGGDNKVKLRINGELIYETSSTIYSTPAIPQALIINTWSIFPFAFNSGLNIIEMEGLNFGGAAAFGAEIYSGSVANTSGYTSTTQLSADTIFSTFDFIGQDIPLSNSGYTCPSGYTLNTCSGTPYCIQIDRQPIVNYCVNDTGLGYDDYFKYGGIHNSEPYWSGETNGDVIYYTTGGTWCLSSVLDGPCSLEGPYPCNSVCPDLCDTYVFSGTCPTPTPTPTINCSVLDFTAIFDCEVTVTPSITPTSTVTPTVTPTPTSSNPCGGRAIDVTITGYTPTPTPTISVTPTITPEITRPCNVVGIVTFNIIDAYVECPSSKQFQDCETGQMFYTTKKLIVPSADVLAPYMIFKANVNGVSKCISFVGINMLIIGVDDIVLVDGVLGYSNLGECTLCTPDTPPTPTPTMTPTISVTPTMTPTSSAPMGYYVYRNCNTLVYLIQTSPGPSIVLGQTFSNPSSESFGDCWSFEFYSATYPTLSPKSTYTYLSGNNFTNLGTTIYSDCTSCNASLG